VSGAGDASQAGRHVLAWYLLVAALGIHVVDEASTGFLEFYNPLVLRVRETWPAFPMPTFTFGVWLAGLVALVAALALAGPLVRRSAPGTRAASWILAAIMTLNGAGHLLGSLYFGRWLPGTTSAPLLLLASVALARATLQRRTRGSTPAPASGI
jgi:hypothetical protein